MHKVISGLGLLSLVLLAGCGGPVSKLTNAPPPELPSNWDTKTVGEVSIGVYPGWTDSYGGDMSFGDLGLGAGTAGFPGVAGGVGQSNVETMQDVEEMKDEMAGADGTLLHITDGAKAIPGEPRTGYKITKIEHPRGYSLEAAAKSARDDLIGEDDPVSVTLPIGQAMMMKSVKVKGIAGDEITKVLYVVVHDKNEYRVTFATAHSHDMIQKMAPEVMETLRIKVPEEEAK